MPIRSRMGSSADPLNGTSPLDSPRVRARSAAAMWLGAAVFGVFVMAYPPPHGSRAGMGAVALVCAVSAIAGHLTGEGWSFRFWVLVRLMSNVFVGVAVYSMGVSPGGPEI